MSQGIQERNLPVAESLGEGDKVRIVTSAGNSKNIDASQIGGGVMFANFVDTDPSQRASLRSGDGTTTMWIDKTYSEIKNAMDNNAIVVCKMATPNSINFAYVLSA